MTSILFVLPEIELLKTSFRLFPIISGDTNLYFLGPKISKAFKWIPTLWTKPLSRLVIEFKGISIPQTRETNFSA